MGFRPAMSVVRSGARVRLGRQDAVDGAVSRARAMVKTNDRIEVLAYRDEYDGRKNRCRDYARAVAGTRRRRG